MTQPVRSPIFDSLSAAARDRILILDGAMGTQIQKLGLVEGDFTGHGGCGCHIHSDKPQQGNNDLLNLTQPDAIEEIHYQYAMAGADIAETNTFSSTTIAQADYGLEDKVYDLNVAGARRARKAMDRATAIDGKQRFVAGAVGPTNRTASISPDVNNPGYRAVSFDDLRIAYAQQIHGLIDGGADIILIETIFDTLNAKAAVFAAEEVFEEKGIILPVMISGTITDLSGRTLSGQTPTAFWHSLRHARPFTIGLNCALGANAMREHLAELSNVADTRICAYPNAGLPNEFGEYDETPDQMAAQIVSFAKDGLLNIVGGCCGSTFDHIRAIAEAVKGYAPRAVPTVKPLMRLSGLEPFTLTNDIPFVNVGERTNVTGSAKFRKLITAADYTAALDVARQQVENGAQIIDINMDEGLIDSKQAVRYPNVYGIDMPAKEEFIAHDRTVEEIQTAIGADWLIYQDLQDLVEATCDGADVTYQFDCSVFDGKYVTGDIDENYLNNLQAARNDGNKKIADVENGVIDLHNDGTE